MLLQDDPHSSITCILEYYTNRNFVRHCRSYSMPLHALSSMENFLLAEHSSWEEVAEILEFKENLPRRMKPFCGSEKVTILEASTALGIWSSFCICISKIFFLRLKWKYLFISKASYVNNDDLKKYIFFEAKLFVDTFVQILFSHFSFILLFDIFHKQLKFEVLLVIFNICS